MYEKNYENLVIKKFLSCLIFSEQMLINIQVIFNKNLMTQNWSSMLVVVLGVTCRANYWRLIHGLPVLNIVIVNLWLSNYNLTKKTPDCISHRFEFLEFETGDTHLWWSDYSSNGKRNAKKVAATVTGYIKALKEHREQRCMHCCIDDTTVQLHGIIFKL